MKIYDDIGIQIPQIYLPRKGINLTKWAVIACDQFTSEPDYWQKVFSKYKIEFAVLNPGSPLAEALSDRPDWTLAYADDTGEVFVRKK